jgi:hypothetical protein
MLHPIVGSNYFNYIILTVCALWAGRTRARILAGTSSYLPHYVHTGCGLPSLLIDGLLARVQRPRRAVKGTYLHLAPICLSEAITLLLLRESVDKSLARPGRKQATATNQTRDLFNKLPTKLNTLLSPFF